MTILSVPRRNRQSGALQDTDPQNSSLTNSVTLPTPPSIDEEAQRNARRSATSRKKRAVYYPTGDGKPMAEDVLHRKLMSYCCEALEQHFAHRPDVLVAGNDFVYYEEGNPKARVSPDCYVAFGLEARGIRHFYKIWEENHIAPAVVIELTSKKTQKEDVTIKRPLYEQTLRVAEYFQFDPTGDYLYPRLQGQRIVNGMYQPIPLDNDRMTSEQLGLELVIEGETLRFYDPEGNEFLRTYAQAEAQRQEEAQRAQAEARRAESADQRAKVEARQAERERQRAQAADRRAEAAEAELARLRQELDALRRQT